MDALMMVFSFAACAVGAIILVSCVNGGGPKPAAAATTTKAVVPAAVGGAPVSGRGARDPCRRAA